MNNSSPNPPGPGWSDLFPVLHSWRTDGLITLERLAREYGDVTGASFFGKRIYLLSHPDLIHHVLITNRENYLKTRGNQNAQLYFGDAMQLNNGEKARDLRRVMIPLFQQSRVTREYCGVTVSATRSAMDGWSPGPRPAMTQDLMELALSVAVQVHFGTNPGQDTERLAGLFRTALLRLNGFLPPAWLPSPANRRFRESVAALDSAVFQQIRDRRSSGPIGPDLLSGFVTAAGDGGRVLSDLEIRNELVSMMAAGYQTVGIALTQTLRLVAQHAAVDDQLSREISRVIGEEPVEFKHMADLPYSDQVVKEALRCAPPAGVIARRVAADDVIGGWHIPANSQVFLSCWVMHRDPRFFEEPLLFMPERWTPEFERGLPPCAYFPFGRGARACVAGALSTAILRFMLVTILQRFRLEPLDPKESMQTKPFDRGDVPLRLNPRVRVVPQVVFPVVSQVAQ